MDIFLIKCYPNWTQGLEVGQITYIKPLSEVRCWNNFRENHSFLAFFCEKLLYWIWSKTERRYSSLYWVITNLGCFVIYNINLQNLRLRKIGRIEWNSEIRCLDKGLRVQETFLDNRETRAPDNHILRTYNRSFILTQQLTNYMSPEDIPKPQSIISCIQE
jgi:hypothetical protein